MSKSERDQIANELYLFNNLLIYEITGEKYGSIDEGLIKRIMEQPGNSFEQKKIQHMLYMSDFFFGVWQKNEDGK